MKGSTLRAALKRLAYLFRKRRDDRELHDELESNLQLQIDDNLRAGMPPDEARRAALLRFGSVDAAKEAVRDRRGIPFLETFAQDIAYALRLLRQNKGWSAVAIVSLALGIGANAALFTLIQSYVLEKLPVRNPDELVAFRWVGQNLGSATRGYSYITGSHGDSQVGATFTSHMYDEFRKLNQTLTDLIAFAPAGSLNVYAGGSADFATGQFVSGNFYEVLGVSAAQGRNLSQDDDSESAAPVVVISHRYWQRRFASDPRVVGTEIAINNVPFSIVGVSSPESANLVIGSFMEAPDYSIPLAMESRVRTTDSWRRRPAGWWLVVMGRSRSEVSLDAVRANFEGVYQRTTKEDWEAYLNSAPPEERARRSAQGNRVSRLQIVNGSRGSSDLQEDVLLQFAILAFILVVVLLIVCVNLANLLLARTTVRQRELALRMSIGATRRRVIRQLLTEGVVLAVIGGCCGLIGAFWSRSLLTGFFQSASARIPEFNWTIIGFAATMTLLTAIVFGIVPALRGTKMDCSPFLREGNVLFGHSRSRMSKVLLVAQVALSLALLVVAGLFTRTLLNLRHVDLGFNPSNLVVFAIEPRLSGYDRPRSTALYEELQRRLLAVPGVQSVTFSADAFLSGSTTTDAVFIGDRSYEVKFLSIDQGFFDTMEVPIKVGRRFTPQDTLTSPQVAIVNEAFADAIFPNENAVGKYYSRRVEIVGVVPNVKAHSLRDKPSPMVYRPLTQSGTPSRTVIVRVVGDSADRIAAIRSAVHDVDPRLPLRDLSTQLKLIGMYTIQERLLAFASAFFGSLALVITMIGLFGLMSYSVARRTRDIGIRIALGARRDEVLRSVLGEALRLVGIGIVIGLVAALGLTRSISFILFGLATYDPVTISIAITVMLLVGGAAAFVPARWASRVDPMVALRYE